MKWFIRLFFKTIRLILGPIMLFADWISTPKGIQRPDDLQSQIDEQTRHLALYEFKTCPFCIKTRRAIKRLSLNIERKDSQHNMENRQQLLNEGGKIKVPCLKITEDNNNESWLYESDAIIEYLQKRFA